MNAFARRPARALLAGLASLILSFACASPMRDGALRYRQGDWVGALELWRSIPPGSSEYDAATRRIEALEAEFDQLVVRYKQRARYFERSGRLAESILNYRLALKLQPDDRQTLAHVQELARVLASEVAERKEALRAHLGERRLAAAREDLVSLRRLDPFDPSLETQEREVEEQIRAEVERNIADGSARFRRGRLDAAQKSFEAALALDPQNDAARGYLSYLTVIRSEAKRAGVRPATLHAPERFATEAEIRAEGLHQKALAAKREGDPWRAIRFELRALHVDSEHAEARRLLDELRAELAPDVDELIETGRRHFRQEDLQSALDQWRRALLIDPHNERAREYVARAERMLENLERLRSEPPNHVGAR